MEPATTATVAQQAAKELGITQLVPAIYQDLLQPAVKEVGQRFVVVARAVAIGLAPLEGAVWGYSQIKDYLSAKIAAKLAEKPAVEIQPPDRVIAGPVVMGMAFAAEAPHLREMYTNLLAAAMHSPSASKVHPSFVQLIQQLSPAEAQILRSIAKAHKPDKPLFDQTEDPNLIKPEPSLRASWGEFCIRSGMENTSLADAYYQNLLRLGILAEISKTTTRSSLSAIGYRAVVIRHLVLTSYGDLFLDVCVRD